MTHASLLHLASDASLPLKDRTPCELRYGYQGKYPRGGDAYASDDMGYEDAETLVCTVEQRMAGSYSLHALLKVLYSCFDNLAIE